MIYTTFFLIFIPSETIAHLCSTRRVRKLAEFPNTPLPQTRPDFETRAFKSLARFPTFGPAISRPLITIDPALGSAN